MHGRNCFNTSRQVVTGLALAGVVAATIYGLGVLSMEPSAKAPAAIPFFGIAAIPAAATDAGLILLLILRFNLPRKFREILALGLALMFAVNANIANYIGIEAVTEKLGMQTFVEDKPRLAMLLTVANRSFYCTATLITTLSANTLLRSLLTRPRDLVKLFSLGSSRRQKAYNITGHILNVGSAAINWIIMAQLITDYYQDPKNQDDIFAKNIAVPLKQHIALTAILTLSSLLASIVFWAGNQQLLAVLHDDLIESRSVKRWLNAIGSHIWNLLTGIAIAVVAAQGGAPIPLIALLFISYVMGGLEASIKMFNAGLALFTGHPHLAMEIIRDKKGLTSYQDSAHRINLRNETEIVTDGGEIMVRRLQRVPGSRNLLTGMPPVGSTTVAVTPAGLGVASAGATVSPSPAAATDVVTPSAETFRLLRVPSVGGMTDRRMMEPTLS